MREGGKRAISCYLNYARQNDWNWKTIVQHFTVTLCRHRAVLCYVPLTAWPSGQCHAVHVPVPQKTHPGNGDRGLRADPTQQQQLHHLPVLAFIWKVQQQVLMRMMNRVVLFWENPARAQRTKCCMISPWMGSAQWAAFWSDVCWCCAVQGSQHLRGCKIICTILSFLC